MPALIERRKMTRSTYQALKRHILREREKRKQEHEADLALERQRKEVERRKRLENENKNSLQQTKDELVRLDKQLEDHRKEKSKLFAQLKRILESENTKKVNEKKHETQLYPSGGQSGPPNHTMHFLSGTGHMGRPVMFKPAMHSAMPPQPSTAVHASSSSKSGERQRSVSPTPSMSGVYPFHHGNQAANPYSSNKYGNSSQDSYPGYSPHSQQKGGDNQVHKSQKHLEQSQSHTQGSDSYPNQHNLAPMLHHKVPHVMGEEKNRPPQPLPQQRHPNPVKGSIVTGYPMHPSTAPHPGVGGRGRPPHPMQGAGQKMSGVKPLYQRDNRPYY